MITAARRKSLSLAGLMFVKVNALLVVRHRGNLSKPVILWATDSGFVEVYFETSTRAGKRSETDYLEDSVSGAGGGCGAHHTASYKLPHRDKKGLPTIANPVYGYSAPAKSGAGIGVPVIIRAHNTRHACFCAAQLHPFNGGLYGGGAIRAGFSDSRLRQPCTVHHQRNWRFRWWLSRP